jgi:hypothetical protein
LGTVCRRHAWIVDLQQKSRVNDRLVFLAHRLRDPGSFPGCLDECGR